MADYGWILKRAAQLFSTVITVYSKILSRGSSERKYKKKNATTKVFRMQKSAL